MTKSECRKCYTEKRNQLSKETLFRDSALVIQQLLQTINFTNKTISTFLPIVAKQEIDTFPLLDRKNELNCRFAIPIADFDTNSLQHLLFESREQLLVSTYGIPEPTYGTIVHPDEIDIVLVPLLCFDTKGRRVGYGKGFYDRFLSSCRPDCQFIGLSLFDPIEEISDVSPHDLPLHHVITPQVVYSFIKN